MVRVGRIAVSEGIQRELRRNRKKEAKGLAKEKRRHRASSVIVKM